MELERRSPDSCSMRLWTRPTEPMPSPAPEKRDKKEEDKEKEEELVAYVAGTRTHVSTIRILCGMSKIV